MFLLPAFVLTLTTPAEAAPSVKVAVCHWTGASFSQINIGESAVSAHTSQHVAPWGTQDHLAGVYYADLDGDGFGSAASSTSTCQQEGYLADNTDCDDDDGDVNPGADEVAYDGIDNDCSADSADDDLDADGYTFADDCDDSDWTVNPGSVEEVYDGVDNDCDATTPDDDLDADGYALLDDCDDDDFGVSPSQTEVCEDGIDNDCSGGDAACLNACPCFDAADIEAARMEWAAESWAYGSYSDCSTVADWTGKQWQLEFVGIRERSSYGYWVRQFYAVAPGSDGGMSACEIGTGPGPAIVRAEITQSEAEACGALVLDVAAELAMTCTEYTW